MDEDAAEDEQSDGQTDSDLELGDLYTSELHDLDIPEPGNATAIFGGVEFTIEEIQCRVMGDGPTFFDARISGKHEDSASASIIAARTVDHAAEGEQEIEEVVLTRTVEDDEGNTLHPASSLYQSVDGSQREWKRGEGELPIIRTDGKILTAVGVVEPNSPTHAELGAVEGPFEVAVHCD